MDPRQFLNAIVQSQVDAETARLEAEAEILLRCGYTVDELAVVYPWPRWTKAPRVLPKSMTDAT